MVLPAAAKNIADQIDIAMAASNPAIGGQTFVEFLTQRQAEYLQANGRHFQGIQLLDEIPADGQGHAPDPTVSPVDQSDSWADVVPFGALPAELLSRPAIDTFQFPNGSKDYSLRLDFVSEGVQYRKTIGYESHFWLEVSWD